MATSAKFGQDVPPEGGYGPIQLDRIKVETMLKAKKVIPFLILSSCIGLYEHFHTLKRIRREAIEARSARFALMPLLIAERDREFLKQLRRNRDIEADLMKGIPEWEIGSYYGEPIYNTATDERLITPTFFEFFAHSWDSMHLRLTRREYS